MKKRLKKYKVEMPIEMHNALVQKMKDKYGVEYPNGEPSNIVVFESFTLYRDTSDGRIMTISELGKRYKIKNFDISNKKSFYVGGDHGGGKDRYRGVLIEVVETTDS